MGHGNKRESVMGKIQFVFPVIIWKRVSFFLVAAFSAIFFLNQSYVARASTNGKSDIAMYDVEVDALQLVGEIVKISPLPKRYKTKLNSQLLENFMVEVKIVTNATGCLNHKFAFLIRKGQIVHRVQKQLLPTYDVFDEKRWFEPGTVPGIIECNGLHLGITICEDIWHSEIGEYDSDPMEELFAANPDIDCLINISASPFQRDKESVRHRLFKSICTKHQVPLLYVNQVGGQDSLLFDGRSLLMDAQGEIQAKSLGFTEDILVVDSDGWSGKLHEAAEEIS